MKLDTRKFVLAAILVPLLMPAVKAAASNRCWPAECPEEAQAAAPPKSAPQTDSIIAWQARALLASANYLYVGTEKEYRSIDRKNLRVFSTTFEFQASKHHYVIKFADLPAVRAECDSERCSMSTAGDGVLFYNQAGQPGGRLVFWDQDVHVRTNSLTCPAACSKVAMDFAAALNSLRRAVAAQHPPSDFHQQAMAWRALAAKPPLPGNVRVELLMAEDALKEKQPEQALNHYESGLKLYPTWPEGHFNTALIAGQLGFYDEAIEHMQAYLELVPEAQDAQSAQDQMAVWQYKVKQYAPGEAR
jgi:tetratricopeptide (TPR) repeat protein